MWITDNIKNRKNKKNITFEVLTLEWLESKKKEVKESSFANYSYTIKKYLMCEYQNDLLEILEKKDFNEYIEELNQDLKPKTVRDIVVILKSILSYANDKYNCNIKIKQIKSSKLEQEPLVILNKEEKDKLEKYCSKENSLKNIGIILCLNTGLRIGEICSLKWKNINLDKKEFYVRSTLQRIYDDNLKNTKVIIDKPKTKASIRNIPISNKIYNMIKEIQKQHNENEYFLTGSSNEYIEPRIYRTYFKKVLRKSKIKTMYRFHILRHTFASDCIGVGMDVKSLSEILGHTTVEMTLNKYVHSSYDQKKKFLEKL